MPREPEFPPLIAGHCVGQDDPFAVAAKAAASGKAGGGDLYWSDTEHALRAAIVLEPEPDTQHAEVIQLATMVALADCIGALSPPEVGLFFRWPEKITVNGAVAGEARLIPGPPSTGVAAAWLIAGVDINIRAEHPVLEPGRTPEVTTLWDEGCSGLHLVTLLESFARHFNTWIHTFETDGARPVLEAWLARAEGRNETLTVKLGDTDWIGTFLGLDECGDLILRTEQGTELLSLKDALL
jgi:BirA family biotin operon repressor/biotin-[acetyl-CoA-carboxylase] ligase